MGGSWVCGPDIELRGVPASRFTYLIAQRLRFGLDVDAALLVDAEELCAHVRRNGVRCAVQLDRTGHHACACGAGGGFVRRHNGVLWALCAELRRMGLNVRTEVWVEELFELHQGRYREARLDLVVTTASGVWYLDVTCYHPFTRGGVRRTHAGGGTLVAQGGRKRRRYVVREAGSMRRSTRAFFVPVVASTYGAVGPAALEFFRGLELYALAHKAAYAGRRPGWLARTVSAAAVHGTARGVLDAFSPPDGQERAHIRGRVAAAAA